MSDPLEVRGRPEFSLVVPCYNEEAVVSRTINKLLEAFSRSGYQLELIAVDNGSWDRTGDILRDWAVRNPAVVHYRVEQNEGYGNGVLSGLRLASAPWVGIIPADGQVDAQDVVRLYEVAHGSSDWVLAKVRRRFRMDGLWRKVVSFGYNLAFRMMWPAIASVDVNASPKILPRDAVAAMGLRSKGWFLDAEIMIKSHALGMRVIEFNVFARQREAGSSHVKPDTCWEFFKNMAEYRFRNQWKRDLAAGRSNARAAAVPVKC